MPPNWLKHLSPRSSSDKDVKKPNAYAYPTFPPPPPQELLSNSLYWNKILKAREHLVPSNSPTDTPLYAIYRMYEHLLLDNTSGLRAELQRFWFQSWPVSSIPDPCDEDPQRYAVLASLPALMVSSFNKRIELGIRREVGHQNPIDDGVEIHERVGEQHWESVPEWTRRVGPIDTVLKIPHEEGKTLENFSDPRASRELAEKNILCWQPHIHFL